MGAGMLQGSSNRGDTLSHDPNFPRQPGININQLLGSSAAASNQTDMMEKK